MTANANEPEGLRRPRVLFVDDEPLVLRSLKRTTQVRATGWDFEFASSAREAIACLDASPVDVIVSDMHMPEMDGAALLRHVQHRHPEVVRIVLSGYSDARLVFRSVPVAHQFLTKPFDTTLLLAALDRALDLRGLLSSPALRGLVAGDSRLPSAPRLYTELTDLLSRDDTSIADVVQLVERDVALLARVAQLASSGFFNAPRSVTTLAGFVRHLGVDVLRTLVLGAEVVTLFRPAVPQHVFSIEGLLQHSLLVSRVMRGIIPRGETAADALLAAMLHDVGKLVLASRLPEACVEAHTLARERGLRLEEAERTVLGASHADVGAYLLGIWGLPAPIVEAVGRHHSPEAQANGPLNVPSALYIANRLAHDADAPLAEEAEGLPPRLLLHLRTGDHLESWRELARRAPAER